MYLKLAMADYATFCWIDMYTVVIYVVYHLNQCTHFMLTKHGKRLKQFSMKLLF